MCWGGARCCRAFLCFTETACVFCLLLQSQWNHETALTLCSCETAEEPFSYTAELTILWTVCVTGRWFHARCWLTSALHPVYSWTLGWTSGGHAGGKQQQREARDDGERADTEALPTVRRHEREPDQGLPDLSRDRTDSTRWDVTGFNESNWSIKK